MPFIIGAAAANTSNAANSGAGAWGGGSLMIVYFIVIIGVMYLVIFLPQRRRDKKTKEMLSAMQVGQNVVTVGGVSGKIVNIKDDEVTITTSIEKTQIVLKKWGIKEVEKLIES